MKTWFEAFKESMNVIFTDEDFKRYLGDVKKDLRFYKKHLGKKARILDLGCGLGVTAVPLSTLGYEVVGIDNDREVAGAATVNARNFGGTIQIKYGDIFDISEIFEKDSFDACISGGLLEHFSEPEIRKLLDKQLILAPTVIASVPLASHPGEVWENGMQRNLWEADYWINNILDGFNIVKHKESKASEAIGGFPELTVIIEG